MPKKIILPESAIVEKWIADPSANTRTLAKEFGCAARTISTVLMRNLSTQIIGEVTRRKISRSTALREDLKTEKHRLNCVKAAKCIPREATLRGIRKAIEVSVINRKGKALSVEHRAKLSAAHIGVHAGSKHPLWKGGTSKICWRGAGWAAVKRSVRERDGNSCQICGKTFDEQGRNMDVHHITSYFAFKSVQEANQEDNLICLCRSCHRRVENNSITCPSAKQAGIPVVVDPRNTSRQCGKCGHIDKRNRKTQSEFRCVACGHSSNADHNAAGNIASRGAINRPMFAHLYVPNAVEIPVL